MARVSVFGLGYVGCVSAACLAREGHEVVGVDVNPDKVRMLREGRPTILEEGILELVEQMVRDGRLRATTETAEAVRATDMSLICVGTPSQANGGLDLRYIERVCEEIGAVVKSLGRPHTVVVRSTVLPGTIHGLVLPTLCKAAGLAVGDPGLRVASNPEFLREGTSIKDFDNPPFTLIGADDAATQQQVASLYAGLRAPVHLVPVPVAEMVKYACNAFHGLKVAFANEIGSIAKAMEIDSHTVMRIFCEDRKLNIAPSYLRPGFAFGGSCLPKDLRALSYRARQLDVATPVLDATLESNRIHVERALAMILSTKPKHVGVLGLSFKPGTDDLRESPMVTVIERLLGKGVKLAVYDRDVSDSKIFGANREYVEREIPHIWELMRSSLDEVLAVSDVIVVGKTGPGLDTLLERTRPNQRVIDLARITDTPSDGQRYTGICW